MRITFSIIIGALILVPLSAVAESVPSIYERFYDDTASAISTTKPTKILMNFIREEMRTWEGNGIVLSEADIDSAMHYRLWTGDGRGLCENKRTARTDTPIVFLQGGTGAGSCMVLAEDILTMIAVEREADQLGADLLAITNGAELSIADEPHRPVNLPLIAMGIRRVWSGTGASVVPWDGSADDALHELEAALQSLDQEELDTAILRFHHGYFRDQQENDPRFEGVTDTVREKLRAIADVLGIVGDPKHVGIFSVPTVSIPNVGLWIRGDDLGLQFIYPAHLPRVKYKQAGVYPFIKLFNELVAYPFAYEGDTPDVRQSTDSPLCSRSIGREGYLCRSLPPEKKNCSAQTSDKITLVRCSSEERTQSFGPETLCPEFDQLFTDDGTSLIDPNHLGQINPALKKADLKKICSPENKILYKDDIESHACYINFCLAESMSGHTLVPNRNTVVANETTSPYLACIRDDPQLGRVTEMVNEAPYPMPEYRGISLVRDMDRSYCGVTGDAPLPIAGLCANNENAQSFLPSYTAVFQTQVIEREGTAVAYRQAIMNSLAGVIGQRVARDQAAEVERKTFAKLAAVIDQIASLLLELKDAPLTQTACPWTGPFLSSPPSP